MRIAIDWLQDFVTLPGNTQELADTLTMLGLEAGHGLDTSQLAILSLLKSRNAQNTPMRIN